MATNKPGPVTIDSLPMGVGANMGDRIDRRDWLRHMHQSSKERVNTVTMVAQGEWYTVWPNLSQTAEAPTVANLVEMGINHWSSVLGAVLPSIRVPVHATADRSEAKRGARKRERRLKELWKRSNWSELAAKNGADYSGAGFSILGVWANFGETDLSKRHPYVIHFDPRHTYILKNDLGEVTELLVARKLSQYELAVQLKAEYPDLYNKWKKRTDDVEEWFWYDQESFFHAIVDVSKDGRKDSNWVVLTNQENELGFVPAYEVVRPTFDGERRGVFDQTIHILRTMHRLMLLTIQSTEENSFPAIGVFDVQNPQDYGPGAIMRLRSPEAKIERYGPDQHFDVKDLIGRLTDEAMRSATFPQQLSGEPGASIVSARGVKASMGALDARLALAHKQFELMYGKISGFLLAMDEIYCNAEKDILGDDTDDIKAESFLPERDINGAWDVVCTYGIGAGSDPANVEIRLNMHAEAGLVSKETVRQNLPFLVDPDGEPVKLFREMMQGAILASALAQAEQTGDSSLAAEALRLVAADDVDFDKVMEQLVEFIQAPQEGPAAAGPGGDPLGALQAGESAARGGGPNAEGGTGAPPGMPPLSQILGQDSRMVS